MFGFDPAYFIFAIPGLILALWATYQTKSTFARYSEVPASSGMSGAEAARRMLDECGIRDVKIEETEGFLSDHYDPSCATLRLSPDVYNGRSLSSIGVACHEAGHAIQHAAAYFPLHIRSGLVPLTNVSSILSYVVLMAGMLLNTPKLILVGAILFSVAVLFSIVTLPVEWDASARAKRMMVASGIVTQEESSMAGKVLNAAFLTYLASAVSSLLMLAYYLLRAGVFGNRSSDE
jgi:Zn-dependent membrane protease YugP